MNKYLIDAGLDFETWITCQLPKQLNVSASKEKFEEISKEISKERAPRGERAMRGWGILKK